MPNNSSSLKPFCLGLLAAVVLFFLVAAVDVSAPSYGRYQISSWSSSLGSKGGAFGAFVLDSATGETKLVYSRTFGDVGSGSVKKNQLKKFFGAIE